MHELNKLQQELKTLKGNYEALSLRYDQLLEDERRAPTEWNFLGHPTGSAEKRKIEKQRLEVGAQQGEAERRISWLQSRIHYLEQLRDADAVIDKAGAEEHAAAQRAARISESLSRVLERLEELQTEDARGTEQQQEAQHAAAQALAIATASGDSKALNTARTQMDKVTAEARDIRAKQEANIPVHAALTAEAEAQRRQLTAAQAEQQEAAKVANRARGLKKKAEWDEAVATLAQIGVGLVSLDAYHGLASLKVPTFAPGSATVTLDDLRRRPLN